MTQLAKNNNSINNIEIIFEGNEMRGWHSTIMRTVDEHYRAIYESLITLTQSINLGQNSLFAEKESNNNNINNNNNTDTTKFMNELKGIKKSDTLFRVRCEEEIQQLESQRIFLQASLTEKKLQCEELRNKGCLIRKEIERLFPSIKINNNNNNNSNIYSLSIPSDGEVLLISRRQRSNSFLFNSENFIPLTTLATASALLEDKIRVKEKNIFKKTEDVRAALEVYNFRIQTLKDELYHLKEALHEDEILYFNSEFIALEAEEEKERLLLEVEAMRKNEEWDKYFFEVLFTSQREVLTQRLNKAERECDAIQTLLSLNPNNNYNNSNNNSQPNGLIEEISDSEKHNDIQKMQIFFQNLQDVHDTIFILNANVINLTEDTVEIENILNELKNYSQWTPVYNGVRRESVMSRSSILQEAYDDAVIALENMNSIIIDNDNNININPNIIPIAFELLKKVKRLCILYNIFSSHPEVISVALMNSDNLWDKVYDMLPAAQRALLILQRKK